MQSNCYRSAIAASLIVAFSASTWAATPLTLKQTSLPQVQSKFYFVFQNKALMQNLPPDTLQFIRQHEDKKQQHVRLQQYYQGVMVYGGYAILHHALAAKTTTMNGTLYQGLDKDLGQQPPDFVNNKALALQQFKAAFSGKECSESEITPIIYLDEAQKAHWAYKVSLLIQAKEAIPEKPTAILDASTYKPYIQWNDIKTNKKTALGMGFGGNNKSMEYTFGKDFPLLQLSRDEATKTCYMENKAVRVVDMAHQYSNFNKTMQFDCSNELAGDPLFFWTGYQADGYDKENGAFSPTNDALYFGEVIKQLYREWYGVEVLTQNNKPMKLVMRVHFGQSYGNAFWDGRQMTFGDGGAFFYPLVSLGISAHEVSHGFTEQHAELAYFRQSGGINESFSDMAAQAAEYYVTGSNTWKIGSEVIKPNSSKEALRYMDEPGRDGVSIDSAKDYRDGLDVHHSSGVFNRLFYLLATTSGWNVRTAFEVMVRANMDYWTPLTTFNEAGCGIISAAQDLNYSVNDVKQALTQVGIDSESCY
ncbi:MAG: M4 family metallopeptidase [Tatlockia sp.]|jgi:pseudolysin